MYQLLTLNVMKRIIVLSSLAIIALACTAYSAKNAEKNVKKTIKTFATAADNQSTTDLKKVLHDDYRVVMNRLFGSEDCAVLSRDAYLKKIESKEWGGDKREVTIENLVVNGNTASAKVTFKGSKMTFVSLMNLVQNTDEEWMVISDMPTVLAD